jgi:hypothetical protein
MERCERENVDAGHLCKETSYGKSDSPLLAPGPTRSVQGQILLGAMLIASAIAPF